ncbi:hypothetical protein BMF89_00115 [Arthrobacter sp. SRS-W-1-2016]|uniref:hypothetical protein n=1 Tax=Arthrobacter sp. SRS-W-1-2016 TaxID=1930254 RepID=UPI000990E523|nr:hypothetical protein [Arthrobacter sp. SRS-W-1-2016]OOP65290.1 hypothetical protein BMF89_00115 [Arthrobacter sp. SRS-W-1-2016]
MTDRNDGDAVQRWAAAERVAQGLPSGTGPPPKREAWTLVVFAVLVVFAISGVVTFFILQPQPLFGDVVAVPGWLKTVGAIVECAGILLGVIVWVRAARSGERPISQGSVVAQLSRTQRRRVANQIKGREPVLPEELNVVLAAARQALILQRFSLRLLPAYFLFALGNLMWTDLGLAKALYVLTLILFVVAAPIALRRLRRTQDFLQRTGPLP